jgi:thioredoxin 1
VKGSSLVLAVAIAAGVIAVPLLLKANRVASAPAGQAPSASKGLPRFVELGTTTCAPCRVMLGVMAELEKNYPGVMVIEFVNVHEQPALADRYGVQVIPTQIFYSPDDRELFRHVGVFKTEEVIAKWAELGFPVTPRAER